MHGKVNMVPSRGTCTLLASYRGRGPGGPGRWELQSGGLQKRAYGVCVREPTPGQMPHRPARGTRDPAALRRLMLDSPGLLSSARDKGEPRDPRALGNPGFSFRRGGVDLGGETPAADTAPMSFLPQRRAGPGEPDRRTAASAAKETFSPEQPGSSTLRQLSLQAPSLLFSKQAPRRSRDARLLGDWARVPHMEAPLLEPLGLECLAALTQPRLAASSVGSALPGPPSHFSCGQFLSRAHSNSIARVSCSSCKLAMHRAYL